MLTGIIPVDFPGERKSPDTLMTGLFCERRGKVTKIEVRKVKSTSRDHSDLLSQKVFIFAK